MERTKYIDPIIGTVGDEQETSMHGGGKTHPGACYPFGMVQLSPDTTTSGDNGTGYNYCQGTIEGFSFNHMSGIGWYGDLGNIQVMPITGKTDLRSGSNAEIPFEKGTLGWKSPFSHENEIAKAGYYSVLLDRYGIKCEATVTCHTGILRFTYPECDNSGIIFNFSRRIAGHVDRQEITVEGNKILGHLTCTKKGGGFGRGHGGIEYDLYFCLELSRPFEYRFFENEEYKDKGLTYANGEDIHLLATFNTDEGENVLIRCGISYTSLDGAIKNLDTECPDFDFDRVYAKTDESWEEAISCATVEGDNETDLTLYYTCLYHALLDPRTQVDSNGYYKNPTGGVSKSTSYTHRTMFSGWDVYRSEFPLLTIINPRAVRDTVNSLLNIALAKNSSVPRWELMGIDSGCMVGDPGVIVLSDALIKGIWDFDYKKAKEIILGSLYLKNEVLGKEFKSARPNTVEYREKSFVSGSLSDTLEYLMADYAASNFAKAIGDKELSDYLRKRAFTYKDNFNKETGFMGPRDKNGEFIPVKDEYDGCGCVESNIFQQGFFVPFDVDGLSELYGKERMIELLERLFEKADLTALWNENYNHSNEPCHNLTHYFNILGKPERTQYWTRRVQKEAYRLGAFGFCGNEDVGQLSSWYVLSAMGFAQVCMTDKRYYLNTPLFKSGKIRLDRKYHSCSVSNQFSFSCDKDPDEYPYIDEVYLNGRKLDEMYISFDQITCGGGLEFKLRK